MTAAKRHDKRVGYVRVSSVDESTERQLDGVELDKVFTDKASGKDTARPQLQAALDYLREGDLLLAHSMDRLVIGVLVVKEPCVFKHHLQYWWHTVLIFQCLRHFARGHVIGVVGFHLVHRVEVLAAPQAEAHSRITILILEH